MNGITNKSHKFCKVEISQNIQRGLYNILPPHPILCFGILWIRETHEKREGRKKKGKCYQRCGCFLTFSIQYLMPAHCRNYLSNVQSSIIQWFSMLKACLVTFYMNNKD